MRGFTRAVVAGNLTRDPEVRYTVNKKAFCRFGVAVNSSWRNANGEVQENTDFINIVVWGMQAENCAKYLRKGRPVLIDGRIRSNTYDAKDGSGKRTTTEIWADNVTFLGSGQGGSDSGSYSSGRPASSQPEMSSPYGMTPPDDAEFGSINDHGFSTGFSQDFGSSSNDSSPDSLNDSEIPF